MAGLAGPAGPEITPLIMITHVGERLACERERHDIYDPFAVFVKKEGNIFVVGHRPRSISTA